MAFTIGKKELRLLYALEKNARASLGELAKAAGISKQLASYKLRRMEEEQIILGYHIIVDVSRLGFTSYRIYLKLKGRTNKQRKELFAEIAQLPEAVVVNSLDQEWDGGMAVMARNAREFHAFWEKLMQYHQWIADFNVSIYEPILYFRRAFLNPDAFEESEVMVVGNNEEVPHDELDIGILRALAPNARQPLVKVATVLGKPVQTIINRIRTMEENGIILGYRPVFDAQALGYEYATAKMTLTDRTRIKEMETYARQIPYIFQIDKTAAGYDFEVEFYVHNLRHFRELMDAFMERFPEIESYVYFTVETNFKEELMPGETITK